MRSVLPPPAHNDKRAGGIHAWRLLFWNVFDEGRGVGHFQIFG